MRKKNNIAFIIPVFPTTTETFIVNQIIYLINKGYNVRIFSFEKSINTVTHQNIIDYNLISLTTYKKDIFVPKYRRYNSFIKYVLKNSGNLNYTRLWGNFNLKKDRIKSFNLKFFYDFLWILESIESDIIHAHFGEAGQYIADIKAKGFLKKNLLITTFHGYDLVYSEINQKKVYKELFEESKVITVNSKFSRKLLIEEVCKKVKILPASLDTFKFNSVRKKISNKNQLKIIFIGRLIPLKAPDLVLEIFEKLHSIFGDRLILNIIGEGILMPSLKKRVSNMASKDQIIFRGNLTQEEVIKLLSDTDLFIFPGKFDGPRRVETQGLVIQEAQAMQVPVIVSDAGGVREGIKEGVTGYVVRQKDVDSFVEKAEYLLKNERIRIRMGMAGRKFVKMNYDSEVLGRRLERIYTNLIEDEF